MIELLEWDFVVDEFVNVFVLGASRFPDLKSGGGITARLMKELSVLLNDGDFYKFISGECLD